MKAGQTFLLLLMAATSGCGWQGPSTKTPAGQKAPSAQSAPQPSAVSTSTPEPASLASRYRVAIVAAGEEEAELREICNQSLRLLQSNEFRTNLLSLKTAENKVVGAASASGPQFVTFDQLADVAALKSNDLHKYRSHFVLHGTYFDTGNVYTGTCKLGSATRDCRAYEFEDNRDNEFVATRVVTLGADSILESVVGRKIHERWRAKSLDRKSCAINTFSHEIMHAFSKIDVTGYHENYFVDTLELTKATQYGGYAIATYLVGSVAQCTWLQQNGRVALEATAFAQCVQRYGLNKFNSDECK